MTDALSQHLQQLLDQWVESQTDEDLLQQILVCLHPTETCTRSHAQVVITSLTHPILLALIQHDRLNPKLKEILSDNLMILLPELGAIAIGPLVKQAHEAQRIFGAEARKYDLVASRVAKQENDIAINTLTAYLQTKPAPMFTKLMASQFDAIWPRVQDAIKDHSHLTMFRAQKDLISALRSTKSTQDELRQAIEQAAQAITEQNMRHRLLLALQSDHKDDRLVAAALACYWREIQLTPLVLDKVLVCDEDGVLFAVLAATLEHEMAKQVFGLFLIDISLGNAESPEYEMTPARTKVVVATRWILPKIGSPIQDNQLYEMAQSVDGPVREALDYVSHLWPLWTSILPEI